jgi:signal transduction histidine kinase
MQNALNAAGEDNFKGQINICSENSFIIIDFHDNGCGIPEDIKNKIFGKGFSTHNGGGFGLYYAKETLAKYGGRIFIQQTSVGKGTTIRVLLKKIKNREAYFVKKETTDHR